MGLRDGEKGVIGGFKREKDGWVVGFFQETRNKSKKGD